MKNVVRIIYGIGFSVFASSCINIYAMQKALTASRNYMFVRSTLLHAYPELYNRFLLVQENMQEHGFDVRQLVAQENSRVDVVSVPFTEDELLKAEQLKKDGKTIGTQELAVKLRVAGFKRLSMNVINYRNTSIYKERWYPKLFSLLERYGYACRNTTLDLWQGLLIHEGAHMLYQDNKDPLVEDELKLLEEIKNPSRQELCSLLETLIPLYKRECIAEYRADQESIKRIQNAAMLRLLSTYHADQGFWHTMFTDGQEQPVSLRIEHLFSPHPPDAMRAAYFAQAADVLEKKLRDKS